MRTAFPLRLLLLLTLLSTCLLTIALWSTSVLGQSLPPNSSSEVPAAPSPAQLIADAMDYWRGATSIATMNMTIHRPDWQRTMTIKSWMRGRGDSVSKVTAPAKDKGNGTLKLDRDMWTYNPKVNRSIKIPPSMMAQSWMGSDFSNNDLAKSDSLLLDYTHELAETEELDGFLVYTIKSLPFEDAPVIWGMIISKVRADHLLLEQTFFDEEFEPVKTLTGLDIEMLGGRLFPRIWTMTKAEYEDDEEGGYTRLEYIELAFDVPVPDRYFTLQWLKTPVR